MGGLGKHWNSREKQKETVEQPGVDNDFLKRTSIQQDVRARTD